MQVMEEPAAGATLSVVNGQLIDDRPASGSVTVTLCSVTLPVLVTRKL